MEAWRRECAHITDTAANAFRERLQTWEEASAAHNEMLQEQTRLEGVVVAEREQWERASGDCTRLNMPGAPCDRCGQPVGEEKRLELLEHARMSADMREARLHEAERALHLLVQEGAAPAPGTAPTPPPVELPPEPQRREIEPVPQPLDLIDDSRKAQEASQRLRVTIKTHLAEWFRVTGGDPDAYKRAQEAEAFGE